MDKAIRILDLINEKVGSITSYAAPILVLVISLDVVFRYIFKFSFIWITELEIYFFAIMFLLGAGYTFKHDQHVRVDVFFAKFSDRGQALVNLLGGLLFLLPWCFIVLKSSWLYALNSFRLGESSPQPGGLPALYILKFCIVLGFFFLALQGLVSILKSIRTIIKKQA